MKNIVKSYNQGCKKTTKINAVNNVSLNFEDNTCYALVGESGCGKSTLSRILTFVEKPDSGEVILDGKSIFQCKKKEIRSLRTDIQLVMQDGQSSLDPHQTINKILTEAMKNLLKISSKEALLRVPLLLNKVGLSEKIGKRYPHELSGGQQKRVCIARAICVSPRYIIFDESLSGLDVTIRKQILDFLIELKKKICCTYVFITHDLDVALYVANHIFVMKEGQILEKIFEVNNLDDFSHPYSKQLVNALKFKQLALR